MTKATMFSESDMGSQTSTILFNTSNTEEMLKISTDGFYVRGVLVPQGEGEARKVYETFNEWLIEARRRQE